MEYREDTKMKTLELQEGEWNFELVVTRSFMAEDVRELAEKQGLEFEEMTVEEVWSFMEANIYALPVQDEISDFVVLN